jgi:hypothetical protein
MPNETVYLGQGGNAQNAINLVGDGQCSVNADSVIVALGAGQYSKRLIIVNGSAPLGVVFPVLRGAAWLIDVRSAGDCPVTTTFGTLDLPTGVYLLWINDDGLPKAASFTPLGSIPINSLSVAGALAGYVITFNGTNVVWSAPTGGASNPDIVHNSSTGTVTLVRKAYQIVVHHGDSAGNCTYRFPAAPTDLDIVEFVRGNPLSDATTPSFDGNSHNIDGASGWSNTSLLSGQWRFYAGGENVWRS